MRWKVMVSAPYLIPTIDDYASFFKENDIEVVVPHVNERLEEEELLKVIGDVDGVICGDDRFTKKVLENAKKLKVIVKWGTGIDSINKAEAEKLNIAVCNTLNAFTEPVADSVLGYMLCFARNIHTGANDMRAGLWDKRPGFALCECTLGIIGVGNIGKAIIKRAQMFGVNIIANDVIYIPESFINETGIKMKSQEELLKEADFVSLNCDLNDSSLHLMSDKEFSLMKSTAYIINTARGPIIDEPALIKALQGKQIAGAGLDVFEHEPLPVDSPLRSMDNCLLSPHNVNSSPEAWQNVHDNSLKHLLRELNQSTV